MPVDSDDCYEDADGNILYLMYDINVRIPDPNDYYSYDEGVVCTDDDGNIQVLTKEFFMKHFRLYKDQQEAS